MSLQKLVNERLTHYDCEIVRKACIFTVKSSAPAAQRRSQVKWLTPIKPEKTPVQRMRCFTALSSGLTPLTPPSPTIKPRRRRRRWKMRGAPPPTVIRPPNAAADHQFVGAQLYLEDRAATKRHGNNKFIPAIADLNRPIDVFYLVTLYMAYKIDFWIFIKIHFSAVGLRVFFQNGLQMTSQLLNECVMLYWE